MSKVDSIDDIPAESTVREIWHQQPGEPDLWYSRFFAFLTMGPGRTLSGAYRLCAEFDQELNGTRPGHAWEDAMRDWRWRHRARVKDARDMEEFLANEEEYKRQARFDRLRTLQRIRHDAVSAINTVDMASLSREQALPSLDKLLKGMLEIMRAERLEFEMPTDISRAEVDITADDMAHAEREVAKWKEGQSRSKNGGQAENPA